MPKHFIGTSFLQRVISKQKSRSTTELFCKNCVWGAKFLLLYIFFILSRNFWFLFPEPARFRVKFTEKRLVVNPRETRDDTKRFNSLLANSIYQAISLQTITGTSISPLPHFPTRSTTRDSLCAKRISLSLLELGSVRTHCHRYTLTMNYLYSGPRPLRNFPTNLSCLATQDTR